MNFLLGIGKEIHWSTEGSAKDWWSTIVTEKIIGFELHNRNKNI